MGYYKVIPLKQCPDDTLLYMTFRSDVDAIVDELVVREPLITTSKMEQVRKLILSIFSTSQLVLTVWKSSNVLNLKYNIF